ncbi:GNAT family N-acetyltransferase [Clostridium hydrogeniformans]|uniref:GNAT family N-acetyltransferase n=1 Tax=Clostridium hydrogeniformans TaxID=349933 RepID=UPI00068D412C|nr:GNAT family protein [Clostridium hydrogeniformans]
MEIITERLLLREFTNSDYAFFEEMGTNKHCLKYESDTVPTKDWIDKKFSETLQDMATNPRIKYRMMISNLLTNESIGRIALWKINDSINEWEIGWDVHPKYWGSGYAPEAAEAMIGFAFNNLKVHRIQAICNDQNNSSEKVMIKIGMKKEGTLRGVRLLNNFWYGSHIYSLLDNEFNK